MTAQVSHESSTVIGLRLVSVSCHINKKGLGCGFSSLNTNSCRAEFFKGNIKGILFFYNFPTLRLYIDSWYPSLWKMWTCSSHILNEVAADDLVTCSVLVSWNIPLSAPAGPTTNEPCYKSICWYCCLKTTPSVWIFPGIFMLWISTIIKSPVVSQHRYYPTFSSTCHPHGHY